MRLLMAGLTAISLPVACTMPCSVLLFWVTNNTCSLLYLTAVRQPAVRAALGLGPLGADAPPRAAALAATTPAAPSPPSAVLASQSVRAGALQTLALTTGPNPGPDYSP
jgi:hypothetical protein